MNRRRYDDGSFEVAVVVQAAERSGDVGALCLLDLEHQFADVEGNRVHPEGVQAALQHMGLDTGLMEGSGPGADGFVRVLAEEKVHLFEGSAVRLDPVEAAHVDDRRGDFDELVHPRDILSRALPHIPVHEGKLYFTFRHNSEILSTKVILFAQSVREKC